MNSEKSSILLGVISVAVSIISCLPIIGNGILGVTCSLFANPINKLFMTPKEKYELKYFEYISDIFIWFIMNLSWLVMLRSIAFLFKCYDMKLYFVCWGCFTIVVAALGFKIIQEEEKKLTEKGKEKSKKRVGFIFLVYITIMFMVTVIVSNIKLDNWLSIDGIKCLPSLLFFAIAEQYFIVWIRKNYDNHGYCYFKCAKSSTGKYYIHSHTNGNIFLCSEKMMSDNCEEYFLIKIENVDSICVGYEDNLEKDDWYIDKLVDVKESK